MKSPKFDVNASYIDTTIALARAGNVEAAEEAMSLFRGAVDARSIDGATAENRKLAEYVAQCFWDYESGRNIDDALHVNPKRGVGQPKGSRKVNEDSYAALLVILSRKLGTPKRASPARAKDKVLELECDASGRGPVSQSKLDKIYTAYAPLRKADHQLLLAMLSPAHRKLLAKTLR